MIYIAIYVVIGLLLYQKFMSNLPEIKKNFSEKTLDKVDVKPIIVLCCIIWPITLLIEIVALFKRDLK